MRIAHLCDVPAAIPEIARWFEDEWAPWYGPGGGGDADADLRACRSRDALPICLIALGEDGMVLGTAALKDQSVGSETGLGPWLAAAIVRPGQRNQGIAKRLFAAIEDEARRLGFRAIYTSSDIPEEAMARRGWSPCGDAQSLRGAVTIYRRDLGSV